LIILSGVQNVTADNKVCTSQPGSLRELFYEAYREEKAIAYGKPLEVYSQY
jgi:hypothetical protein